MVPFFAILWYDVIARHHGILHNARRNSVPMGWPEETKKTKYRRAFIVKKCKSIKILQWLVCAILLVYLAIFGYMNLCKYAQHVDSDIAAEALLAREIWQEKNLTPDDWIASTERYAVGMPTIAALFYGMTGSMQTAVGLACILLGSFFLLAFYYFLRKLSIGRPAAVTALLVLCALPINGWRNEDQMVPFVTLLLFLFADYYVLHSIYLFLSFLFYLQLREQKAVTRKTIITWGLLFVAGILLNLGGQRCLQVVILPFLVMEVLFLFLESKHFSEKLPKERFLATGFVGSLILSFVISSLKGFRASYIVYLESPHAVVERLLVTVPAAILENFGLNGDARVGNFSSIMQMLVWAFLILLGYGIYYVIKNKEEVTDGQRMALSYLGISVGVTAFIISFTTAEAAHYYFFMSWFAAALIVALLVEHLAKDNPFFTGLILAAVCLFALLNLKYTYYDAVTTEDNLKEYQEVADFLEEEGIEYGYAEFWDAERICLITDGAVTMGHSYNMADLAGYWWLTSTKWYPPALPTDMRTAYVVRTEKREAFEAQFAGREAPALKYENERLAVYIGNKNYVDL